MKRMRWLPLVSLGLLLAVSFIPACSNSDPAGAMLNPSAFTEEDGFTLEADPTTITIDLGDPGTPVDPGSGKAYGEATITATALDGDGEPQEGLEIVFSTDAGELSSEGNPVMTDDQGVATDTLRAFEDDPGEIEVSATDGERVETITVNLVVEQPNRPPVADAGDDVTKECESEDGTPVALDGSGSSDPDSTPDTNDDIVSFEWFVAYDTPDEQLVAEGEVAQASFPLGTHEVTLLVTDSEGEADTDSITVEIQDTTPPVLELTLDPTEIWPPNHKMVDVHASIMVADCSEVQVELLSVSSNEPDNDIGDGNHEPDIMGADVGTEDYHFQVRAERAGPGSGRVYTVVYRAIDDGGLERTATAYIRVPHDQGH